MTGSNTSATNASNYNESIKSKSNDDPSRRPIVSSENKPDMLDVQSLLEDRLSSIEIQLSLDRILVGQAQTSGQLNAKRREVMELMAKTQKRLAESKVRIAEGLADSQQVRDDLDWAYTHIEALKRKAKAKHSHEYNMASEKFPALDD